MAIVSLAATLVFDGASGRYFASADLNGSHLSTSGITITDVVLGLIALVGASGAPGVSYQVIITQPIVPQEGYAEPGGPGELQP